MAYVDVGRLDVKVSYLEGIPVLEARGECDIATSPILQDLIDRLMKEGSARLILDIRGLQYIDSAGLNLIIRVRNRAVRNNGALVLLDHIDPMRRVLKLLQFDRLITIVGSHMDALEYIRAL